MVFFLEQRRTMPDRRVQRQRDLVVLRAATMLKSVADELLAEPLHASRRQSDIEHNSLYWNITGI